MRNNILIFTAFLAVVVVLISLKIAQDGRHRDHYSTNVQKSERTGHDFVLAKRGGLSIRRPKSPIHLVDRNSDEIQTVIEQLQAAEASRVRDVQKVSADDKTYELFTINPPSPENREILVGIVNSLEGYKSSVDGEEVSWSEHLREYYGLDDEFARTVNVSFDNKNNYVEFHLTVLKEDGSAGRCVGGAVVFSNEMNSDGAWRFSHLIQFEESEN